MPTSIALSGAKSPLRANALIYFEQITSEIRTMSKLGILKSRLVISKRCHLFFDFHKQLEVTSGIVPGHGRNWGKLNGGRPTSIVLFLLIK